jgi:AcrR family transcriptional regulator
MATHHNSSQPARDGRWTPDGPLVARPSRLPAVREAALTLFAERGYRGTTMNDIAELLGVRGPSLYHHVASKHELLREIMVGTMDRLLADHQAAVGSTDDIAEQLRRAAEAHVRYHARHRREAFVGNREIWSLEEPDRLLVLARRDEYEGRFRSLIQRGVEQGRFRVGSVRLASYAILEMGIGVSSWFRDDGPLSEAQVAYQYGEFALRIAGANLPPGQADPPVLQEA